MILTWLQVRRGTPPPLQGQTPHSSTLGLTIRPEHPGILEDLYRCELVWSLGIKQEAMQLGWE